MGRYLVLGPIWNICLHPPLQEVLLTEYWLGLVQTTLLLRPSRDHNFRHPSPNPCYFGKQEIIRIILNDRVFPGFTVMMHQGGGCTYNPGFQKRPLFSVHKQSVWRWPTPFLVNSFHLESCCCWCVPYSLTLLLLLFCHLSLHLSRSHPHCCSISFQA